MGRHTRKTIEAARNLYLTGASAPLVAKSVKASQRIVYTWINKFGWEKERDEIERKAAEKRKEELIDDRTKIDRIYYGLWNSYLKGLQANVLAKLPEIPDAKDRAAAYCTAGLSLLRAHKGHYISLGIRDDDAPPARPDEVEDMSDAELKKELDALRKDAGGDGGIAADAGRETESETPGEAPQGGTQAQSA